jgi:hypothetical protein
MEQGTRRFRSPSEIERDISNLLASRLTSGAKKERLDIVWDEVNIAAMEVFDDPDVRLYVSLLRKMQDIYDSRFAQRSDDQ